MPKINAYKCNKCDFKMPTGWGGHIYVENTERERIICPHPEEFNTIKNVLGFSRFFEFFRIRKKIGFNSDCVCFNCLNQCKLDTKKDSMKCFLCKQKSIKTLDDIINQSCPKCKKGIVEKIYTGSMC